MCRMEVLYILRFWMMASFKSFKRNLKGAADHAVRIVAKMGKKWLLDPPPSVSVHAHRLLFFSRNNQSPVLFGILEAFFWTNPLLAAEQQKRVPFFQYSMRKTRKMLLGRTMTVPATTKDHVWIVVSTIGCG